MKYSMKLPHLCTVTDEYMNQPLELLLLSLPSKTVCHWIERRGNVRLFVVQ